MCRPENGTARENRSKGKYAFYGLYIATNIVVAFRFPAAGLMICVCIMNADNNAGAI